MTWKSMSLGLRFENDLTIIFPLRFMSSVLSNSLMRIDKVICIVSNILVQHDC